MRGAAPEAEMGLPARMGCPECVPPIPPCPSAHWLAGFWPSITLDRNGNPVIAYGMQLQAGGGACSVGTLAQYGAMSQELGNPAHIHMLDRLIVNDILVLAAKFEQVVKRAALVTHCGQKVLANTASCYSGQ